MGIVEKDHHWVPTEMHGVIPMPTNGDIQGAISKAMRKLVEPDFRRPTTHCHYIIHTDQVGNQFIVFEVKEFGDE